MRHRGLLVVFAVVGVLLVVVVGASRATFVADGVEQPCPDRVWSTAVSGLTDRPGDPGYACTRASQSRLFAVAAGVMGLVLISGLLSRRD